MSPSQAISELYRRSVDCGLESYQGIGVIAWFVDERNRRVEKTFSVEALEQIGDWWLEKLASSDAGSERGVAHEMLAGLASCPRKDPQRVEGRRLSPGATRSGTEE